MSGMSSLSNKVLNLVVIASLSGAAWPSPADEVSDMLARAEALYYQADFGKSIDLLLRADDLLRQQPGQLKEKTEVKLQLALAFIGLNDSARAKAYLGELYALDSDRQIDPQTFSPKVIRLAEEAKAEQNERQCRSLLEETQNQLTAGNGDAVFQLIRSNSTNCSGLMAAAPKAAELLFKDGLNAYKKAQMSDALQKFRATLVMDPKHELAAQYIELTESKVQVTAERALLAWRKNFNAGEFSLAARDYRELTAVSSSETINEVRGEYRRMLSSLVDVWNRACANDDKLTMEEIRGRINTLLPEPSIGEDVLTRMTSCKPTACIPMSAQLALTRLRTRVDPQFPAHVISQIKGAPVTVRVKAKIDEKGNVTSGELEGGNALLYNPIRAALTEWKFSPAVVEGEPRCVDTEIPFIVNVK
jgi:hypothetical protein